MGERGNMQRGGREGEGKALDGAGRHLIGKGRKICSMRTMCSNTKPCLMLSTEVDVVLAAARAHSRLQVRVVHGSEGGCYGRVGGVEGLGIVQLWGVKVAAAIDLRGARRG